MGYNAIPALNDTGLSVPMAIDAGLGEFGRHGRLIHPQFGSNVRIWKVLTDMPLEIDPYLEFGASTFCESCRICVKNCPSSTLSYGSKTWTYDGRTPTSWEDATDEPWDATKADGVLKWYEEPKTCLRFWIENGSSCSNCTVTCPFTQSRGWLAKLFRLLSGNGPGLDGTLETLAGGNGRNRAYIGETTLLESDVVWSRRLKPYGLSQDPEFE